MRRHIATMVTGICCALALAMPVAPAWGVPASAEGQAAAQVGVPVIQTHRPQVAEHDFEASAAASRSRNAIRGQRLTVSADVTGLATVGVTWKQDDMERSENAPTIRLRYQSEGVWSEWVDLPATDEDAGVAGVSPSYYVGDADRVEATITPKGGRMVAAQLITIDSGYAELPSDAGIDRATVGRSAVPENGADDDDTSMSLERADDAVTVTGRIHTREEWWADGNPEMFWTPDRSGYWKGAIVHHTVDRNDYTQAEVPAMINGIYLFHNETRGWGDIGYQLIVDRFGGIWEGRDEGVPNQIVPASQVDGAQAVNFNHDTFGVSLLGSYHLDEPPTDAQIASTAAAIAWEFQAMGLQPSDAWGTFDFLGVQARITGHGDASHHDAYGSNETLCPGQQVWDRMGRIRDLVRTDMLGVSRMPAANVRDGTYHIASMARNMAVAAIPEGATGDGVLPRLQGWTGAVGQNFQFTAMGDGSYLIVSKASGKALTVTKGVAADNAGVSQQPVGYDLSDHDTDGSGGGTDGDANGDADISTDGDAGVADAPGIAPGPGVGPGPGDGPSGSRPTKAQLWFVRDSGDGYYLQSALGEEVLDLSGGVSADGTAIALYGPNGGINQRWTLQPVTEDKAAGTNMSFVPGADVEQDGSAREYRGMSSITRQDMAAFLYRWAGSPEFTPSVADQSRFADVDESTPFAKEIWWLASEGISTGWKEKDGTYTFRGASSVTRQDMAAFMHRLVGTDGLPRTGSVSFADVNWSTPHAGDITWLADVGVTTGWNRSDGQREFRGMTPVTRQDMAAFLQRLAGINDASAEKTVRASWGDEPTFFRDVTVRTPHAWSVWWMGLKGMSTGWFVADAEPSEPEA